MNTTPLIDVMLVLLVMLIITIPVQLHAINLNMPTGMPPPDQPKPEIVRIDVDEVSQLFWQGELVPDNQQLEALMATEAGKSVQPEVHLRPDRRARYAVVAGVMASAQRLGLTKIGVVGSEQFAQ